jgi:hypothetical protein
MSGPITTAFRSAATVTLVAGALCLAPAAVAPAQGARAAADFAGFTAEATATPLKIEVFEPAIPIPADPQFELDFSYTRADGTSGPTGTARASALWPGDSVGEGWKTVGEAIGLPDELTKDGYPIQVNAASPGETTHSSQEPLPGVVTRADASDKRATAKAGYSTSGDTSEGRAASGPQPTNPLTALSSGDLSALGSALTGTTDGSGDDPTTAGPLGAFSALVDVGGVQSVSTTDYSGDTVIARSTSRLADVSLVGGLVELTGVEVVAATTSNLAAGAKSTDKVRVGGITIAGQSYALTPDGIEGGDGTPPIPGLPADPTAALKALGIGIEMPKPHINAEGPQGDIAVRGIQVTIDTTPLKSALPALPIGDLVGGVPDEAGQLKSLLLALGEAHPKVVLSLGANTASAATAAGFDIAEQPATDGAPATGASSGSAPAGAGAAPAAAAAPEVAPALTSAPVSASTALSPASAVPGLPPLGSIPAMLALLGLALASGAGWYLRRAGGLLFGVGSSCSHGLKAGVPDLRKA